jgi:hypothetical protein
MTTLHRAFMLATAGEALIIIATGDVYAAALPGRALRLVREWLAEHRDELARDFAWGAALEPLDTIALLS